MRDIGITTVLTGVRMPRMNAITERWVKTLRSELLDRTPVWNETHLRRVLREYEQHYNMASELSPTAYVDSAPEQATVHVMNIRAWY